MLVIQNMQRSLREGFIIKIILFFRREILNILVKYSLSILYKNANKKHFGCLIEAIANSWTFSMEKFASAKSITSILWNVFQRFPWTEWNIDENVFFEASKIRQIIFHNQQCDFFIKFS